MTSRTPFWLTAAALLTAFAVVGSDVAEARNRRPRGRKPHRFLSAPAPSKGRTPAVGADGAPAASARDVAGAAFEGAGRKDVLSGGAAVVLSDGLALVANPYRGLSVVDVSDADAPTVVGSVALQGSADRVFLSGDVALVVSRSWLGTGGRTTVVSVDLADPAHPSILGTAVVDGDLIDASVSGADLVVVTSTGGWGPYPMMDGRGGEFAGVAGDVASPATGAARSAERGVAAGDPAIGPGFWFPWSAGEAKARVARVGLDADSKPVVAGVSEAEGTLLAASIDGDDVVLALDRTIWWSDVPVPVLDAPTSEPALVLVDVDASSTTRLDGTTPLAALSGVSALDAEGHVARVMGWAWGGMPQLLTFALGAENPVALGAAELPTWPGASVFSGDHLAYTYSTGSDPAGEGGAGTGDTKPGVPEPVTWDGPWAWLATVDLSDPTSPQAGTPVRLGDGWTSTLHAVDGGVVATLGDWDETPSTEIVRVDLGGSADPQVGAAATLDGSWYASHLLGDVLLLSGGAYTEEGGYEPQVVPVSLASGGAQVGGAIDAVSWVSAAAWESPILALASADSLRLVDLSDLAAPAARGSVRLAANVADLAVLGDSAAACLVTDYVGGTIEVRTVALPGADPLAPLDVVEVGTGDARLFRDGSMLYVLGTDWRTGGGQLTVVDAADPRDLRVRGSLDLASYPGQAFLVDGALVLLREAWSLVTVDEETGRRRSKTDPFGRCPPGYARDELASVIDVIDLSDPDAPRAAVRRRVRWDYGGEAVLRGTTLYVPSYSWTGTTDEGYDEVAYGVYAVDLDDPMSPRIGRLVAVPGSLVGAADGDGRVLTASYEYDETDFTFTASLNLVDLRAADWRDRVIATRPVEGTIGAVVVGADHAYVATETWDADASASEFALDTLRLSDLGRTSSAPRERSAWGGTISSGTLFLRSWGWTGAIDTFELSDPAAPAAGASAEVDGVGTTVGVAGGRAYVPAGYRGVVGFDLAP
jgi:hypothetical protein